MALSAKLTGPCWRIPLSCVHRSIIKRTFLSFGVSSKTFYYQPLTKSRSFQTCSARKATFSDSPAAKGYIASLEASQGQRRVDVKKVLVIGSGGLSIGYDILDFILEERS